MSLLSADECRTIRELYWKEIDSGYKTAILDHLQWSDPLSITFRGENGTGRFGKSANKILGFCLPDADEHAVGSVQAKLFEAFGSLENYLRQKRGAADGQLAEAFASLVGEIWDMKGSGKECVISAIRDAFGDEIDANFRTDFLKQAGWYDPLCIKNRAGGESVASKGILYGKLLGLEPTRCLSPMQRSILKEIHGSFDAYISNCHQGGLSSPHFLPPNQIMCRGLQTKQIPSSFIKQSRDVKNQGDVRNLGEERCLAIPHQKNALFFFTPCFRLR